MFRGNDKPRKRLKYKVHDQTYTMPNIKYETTVPNLLYKSTLEECYDAMKLIHTLFTGADIKYVANGGTLLGAIRHEGQIPWDDDIDICVLGTQTNIDKIAALKEDFAKEGFQLLRCIPGFAVQKVFLPALSVDIFFMDERIKGTRIYECSYPYNSKGEPTFMVQDGWSSCKLPIDWNGGITTHPFFDYKVCIPTNYVEHLEIMYRSNIRKGHIQL